MMKPALRVLGYLWSVPHSIVGLLLLATVYWPQSVRWSDGAIDVIVRWRLIPRGVEGMEVGAQTHGALVFYADATAALSPRLRNHERYHVAQGMLFGPLFPVLYGLSSLLYLWPGGRPPYLGNHFEQHAYRNEGRLPWIFRA